MRHWDLMRNTVQLQIEIVGRRDSQIKVAGQRLELALAGIEAVFNRVAGIARSASRDIC